MRIVVDLTALADNLSGLERVAMNIVRQMVLMDYQNHYILLFKNEVCPQLQDLLKNRNQNVTVRVYQGRSKLIFNQLQLPFYLYKEKKADKYLFLAFPCPILFRAKGIYTLIADMVAFDCPETMKPKARLFFRTAIKHSWRVSERIVTISEFSKKRIMHHMTGDKESDKILLAYCGISEMFTQAKPKTEEERQKIREKYKLPQSYFLCLSTLEPRKNLSLLVEAYAEALSKETTQELPSLVLAGRKGWLIDELLNQIDEKYRHKVIVTGFIDDEDLAELYRMADCFLFPTKYEGFGMPPLEALAVGTPVISSDAASMPEVLGTHAAYFTNGNKDELVQHILERTVTTRKPYIDDRFNWKRSAEIVLGEINAY